MKFKKLFFISLIATLIMTAIMVLHGNRLKVDNVAEFGIIDLELAATIPNATAIYNAWHPQQITRATSNIFLDFIYILSYGAFLFTACLNVSYKYHGQWQKIGRWLSRGMILAAIFDVLENILMLRTLTGHFSKEVVATTFIFASIKFILIALTIVYIIFSLLTILVRKKEKNLQYG